MASKPPKPDFRTSVAWFKNMIAQSKRTGKAKVKTLRGKLLFMVYDPIYKKKLKYYDTYPLIFAIEVTPNYLLGINVHYLNVSQRNTLVKALYRFGIEDSDDDAKLKFRYRDVEDFVKSRHVHPCLKKYKVDKVKNWMLVPADEWNNLIGLPLQNFIKESATTVWRDSSSYIRGDDEE